VYRLPKINENNYVGTIKQNIVHFMLTVPHHRPDASARALNNSESFYSGWPTEIFFKSARKKL